MNTHLLMSSARYFSNQQAINPYYHPETVDVPGAEREHEAIAALFLEAGIRVEYAEPPASSQDGVYTANWALVRGDTAVLARLPAARSSEEAVAQKTLEHLGKTVITVPEDWHFSGQGDALACGDWLLCGNGYRSDERAQQFAAETLRYTRIQLQTIPKLDATGVPVINSVSGWPDSFFYDIDLALAIIRQLTDDTPGLIAYCPEAFTPESQATLASLPVDKIIVSLDEATHGFACNLVSTGDTVIMSDRAPALKAALEAHGLRVLTPHITELIKGGGFIRCVSLSLN